MFTNLLKYVNISIVGVVMIDDSVVLNNTLKKYNIDDIEIIDVSIPYPSKNDVLGTTGVLTTLNFKNNTNIIEIVDVSKRCTDDIEIIDASTKPSKSIISVSDDIIIIDESKVLNSTVNREVISNTINFIRRKIKDCKSMIIKIVVTATAVIIGCIGYCKMAISPLNREVYNNEQLISSVLKEKTVVSKYNDLFINDIPKEDIEIEDLHNIEGELELISDSDLKDKIIYSIGNLSVYFDLKSMVNQILIDDVLRYDYKQEDVDKINTIYSNIPNNWKADFEVSVKSINNQVKQIEGARLAVANLFITPDKTIVKDDISRSDYEFALRKVNALKQVEIKASEASSLKMALNQVVENENRIKAAWVVNKVPYVSQNNNKVYNGCEAASLLMALQYKGYLKGVTLQKIASDMPKSETNPHEGFIRGIYEPTKDDLPHWIAPDALVKFAKNYSGNQNIYNLTGTSFDKLMEEVKMGNPVIIYITNGGLNKLNNPKWNINEEVPANLHVVVLKGYNPLLKKVVVSNPWTMGNIGDNYYSIDRITSIYNQIGKKAIVVK